MICRGVILLGLLNLAAAITFYRKDSVLLGNQLEVKPREKRAIPYQGPPAPLNRDGTVALTPEIQQLNSFHNAAYAQEFQRLQAAANLAAAHPDRTSPTSPDYNPNSNGQYSAQPSSDGKNYQQLYSPISYNPGTSYNQQQYTPPAYTQATPYSSVLYHQQYNPAQNQPVSYNLGTSYNQQHYSPTTYKEVPFNQQLFNPAASNPVYYNQGMTYNQQTQVPAPLNPDGTAAQTAEFNALAASLKTAYQQALSRPRRSAKEGVVLYHGPPAPLNRDGTVAFTQEVLKAKAAHRAAYVEQYRKLQVADKFAAAHPDLSSPTLKNYNSEYNSDNHYTQDDKGVYDHYKYKNGEYNHQQEDDGQYKPYLYEQQDYHHHQSNDGGYHHQHLIE